MSKNDKLLTKFKTAKSIAWAELVKVLTILGYSQVEGSGSRVKFDNKDPKQLINLHEPHPEKELKTYALKQVREKLKEWGTL